MKLSGAVGLVGRHLGPLELVSRSFELHLHPLQARLLVLQVLETRVVFVLPLLHLILKKKIIVNTDQVLKAKYLKRNFFLTLFFELKF